MVDFRQELRPASFRGLAFDMPDDDGMGGRRWVTHEYPGRDEPDHEDMGAAVRAFSFRAVIIGEGFVARADALEAAFQQAGAGTLIHPHYGELQVIVKDWRPSHSSSAIGQVEFSVTVERYTESSSITAAADTARKLSFASDSMFSLANNDFVGSLAQAVFPEYVTADGVSRLGSFLQLAQDTFRYHGLQGMSAVPAVDTLDAGAAGKVTNLFQGIVGTARPQATPIVGSAPVVTAVNTAPVKLMRALVNVANSHVDLTTFATSPSRKAIGRNASAISTLIKTNALAAAGGVARYATYDSREQALETRNLLADSLSALRDRQLVVGLRSSWRATSDMLVAVTEDINERIGRLPRTVKVQGSTVRPSLAIAHRLYGDDSSVIFDRAADIVKRNRIAHPGFVGVKPLEVLIDG